jgi:hypothetical protein
MTRSQKIKIKPPGDIKIRLKRPKFVAGKSKKGKFLI